MGKRTGKVAAALAAGPLGPFVCAYRERLDRRGYAPVTTAEHVIHLGHLSRWLEAGGMGAADLNRDRLGQFVVARRALVGQRTCSLQSLLPVLEILDELGVVSAQRPAQPVWAAEVIVRFLRVLSDGRARRFFLDGSCLRAARPALCGRLCAGR